MKGVIVCLILAVLAIAIFQVSAVGLLKSEADSARNIFVERHDSEHEKVVIERRDSEREKMSPEEIETRSLDRRCIWYRLRRCEYFLIRPIFSNDTSANSSSSSENEDSDENTTSDNVITTEIPENITVAENNTVVPAGNETLRPYLVYYRCYYYYYCVRPIWPPWFGIGPVVPPRPIFNVTGTAGPDSTAAPTNRRRRDYGRPFRKWEEDTATSTNRTTT